jgi:predicted alpha/beta hydrolase
LGGQLAALYLAMGVGEGRVDGTILVASGSVYFRSYRFPDSVKVLCMTQFARGLASALGYFPGDKLGFAGREARGVIRDWASQALTGRYDVTVGGAAAEDALARATGNVLVVSVENDVLAPASAVDHLCGKLKSAHIERWHYAPEPGVRIDHFRWVKQAGPVARRVRAWIDGVHGVPASQPSRRRTRA